MSRRIARLRLSLEELLLAGRLAEVPLPVRADPVDGLDRISDRLSGRLSGAAAPCPELLAASLGRVDDPGPTGARASLEQRSLLDGTDLDPGLAASLALVAGAPLGALCDLSAVRADGVRRLRSWLGVTDTTIAQLSTADGLAYELSRFDRRLWVAELARTVTVEPWFLVPAPMVLPGYVSLPSELLAGSEKAHRERRPHLVPLMAASSAGRVRLGEPGAVRVAEPDEVLALLATLGAAVRGRLRLVLHGRDDDDGAPPQVASWLLLDGGWHELRPGRGATAVLRRRVPRDLGLVTWPVVRAVAKVDA